MVRYSLRCAQGHGFESWFASAGAFDDLAGRGLLSCAECGSESVEKGLMAPAVRVASQGTSQEASRSGPQGAPPVPRASLSAPATPREAMLAKVRRHVEETSDYVGPAFAAEARRLHEAAQDGSPVPARAIWGETRPDEARALIEDGIPVAPLPFMPRRSTN